MRNGVRKTHAGDSYCWRVAQLQATVRQEQPITRFGGDGGGGGRAYCGFNGGCFAEVVGTDPPLYLFCEKASAALPPPTPAALSFPPTMPRPVRFRGCTMCCRAPSCFPQSSLARTADSQREGGAGDAVTIDGATAVWTAATPRPPPSAQCGARVDTVAVIALGVPRGVFGASTRMPELLG